MIPVGDSPTGIAITSRRDRLGQQRARRHALSDRPGPERGRPDRQDREPARGGRTDRDSIYVAVSASGARPPRRHADRAGSRPRLDRSGPRLFWDSLILTNDGLTGYRRVGGSDGARLVPDLAISLPTPTDGGRTYTFQLRPGIHYSTGALVRPADFRRAIERRCSQPGDTAPTTAASSAPRLRQDSEALRSLARNRGRSRLEHGYLPSDRPGPGLPVQARATRRLRRSRRHAVHGAAAAAGDRPVHDRGLRREAPAPARSQPPLPRVVGGRTAERLPGRDRPDGRRVVRGAQLAPSSAGRPTLESSSCPRSAGFRTQYASQLQSNPQTNTGYFFLNTRVPPFDDVRVRRAVNLAIDRNRGSRAQRRSRILTTDLPGTTAEFRRLPAVLPLHDRPSSRRYLHGARSREGPGARRCVRHPWTAGDRLDRREAARHRWLPTSSPCSRPSATRLDSITFRRG